MAVYLEEFRENPNKAIEKVELLVANDERFPEKKVQVSMNRLSLNLRDAEEALEFVNHPDLTKVEALVLHLANPSDGPDVAELFANSDNMRNVKLLNFLNSPIGEDGAKALAGSRNLPELKALHLADVDLSDDGVAALEPLRHRLKNITVRQHDRPSNSVELTEDMILSASVRSGVLV